MDDKVGVVVTKLFERIVDLEFTIISFSMPIVASVSFSFAQYGGEGNMGRRVGRSPHIACDDLLVPGAARKLQLPK